MLCGVAGPGVEVFEGRPPRALADAFRLGGIRMKKGDPEIREDLVTQKRNVQ